MPRSVAVLLAVILLTFVAVASGFVFFASVLAGNPGNGFLWLGVSVVAILLAVFAVVRSGGSDEGGGSR